MILYINCCPRKESRTNRLANSLLEKLGLYEEVKVYEKDITPLDAKKLYYVTTAGGPLDERFGYGYIKTLALDYFGIKETSLIKAEMLDILGNDSEKILKEAILDIKL